MYVSYNLLNERRGLFQAVKLPHALSWSPVPIATLSSITKIVIFPLKYDFSLPHSLCLQISLLFISSFRSLSCPYMSNFLHLLLSQLPRPPPSSTKNQFFSPLPLTLQPFSCSPRLLYSSSCSFITIVN